MEISRKQKEWKDCLDALCDLENGLDEWEVGFIESVSKQTHFSLKQGRKIEEIYDKHLNDM